MSTPIQIDANRQNSQASTGPRTAEGKAAASGNSTTHGLSSAFVLLPHEDREELNALATRCRAEFSPQDEHEIFLIDQMIHARWRLARIQRFEGTALELMLEPENPEQTPDHRIVSNMMKQGGNVFSLLERYASAAERSYHRNYRELIRHRKEGKVFQKQADKQEMAALDAFINSPPPGWKTSDAASTPASPPPAPVRNPHNPGIHPTLGNLALRL